MQLKYVIASSSTRQNFQIQPNPALSDKIAPKVASLAFLGKTQPNRVLVLNHPFNLCITKA
jgi:hypothetical protein